LPQGAGVKARVSRAGREWDQHWERYEAAASSNPAMAYRRRLVLGAVAEGSSDHIADLGCGQGDLCAELGRGFPQAQLLGVDASREGLSQARRKLRGLKAWQADLEKAPVPPKALQGWADVVTCTEVLEHLDHPAAALRTARRLLKPGGRLILTVPGGPRSAYDVHIGHRRHFTPASLEALLREGGFEPQVWGAGFPFFNLYRLSVIARGAGLVQEAAQASMSLPARLALGAFGQLFKLNVDRSPFGWQVFSIAARA
jgi:SAM-dependent methyltransferase